MDKMTVVMMRQMSFKKVKKETKTENLMSSPTYLSINY